MDDLSELLQQALATVEDLEETLGTIMHHSEINAEAMEDILYELSEIRNAIEDKIED